MPDQAADRSGGGGGGGGGGGIPPPSGEGGGGGSLPSAPRSGGSSGAGRRLLLAALGGAMLGAAATWLLLGPGCRPPASAPAATKAAATPTKAAAATKTAATATKAPPASPLPTVPPRARSVRVAAVQAPSTMGDIEGNSRRLERLVREAAGKGAKIVVLPEASITGYLSEELRLNWRLPGRPLAAGFEALSPREAAQVVPGPTTERFGRLAQELAIYLVAPFVEREPSSGRYFNTACLFGPDGRMLLHYRKLNPWPHPEISWATPGDRGLAVVDTPYGRLGLLICFDVNSLPQWLAAAGAETLLYPIAWVEEPRSTWFEWELPGIARDCSVNIIGANWSVTKEQKWHGYGQSRVIDRTGKVLAAAKTKIGEEIVYATLELAATPRPAPVATQAPPVATPLPTAPPAGGGR